MLQGKRKNFPFFIYLNDIINMAQIKKEKRETRDSKITSLIAENDNLFQSADVDQSRKNQAKAVIDFAQQVMDAEEFTGRDSKIYNLGVQEAVNKILKGEQAYSESMTGSAKTNIFGYYSRHGAPSELDWMVNETVKRAISGNTQPTAQRDQSSSQPAFDTKQIVKFTPSAGFSSYVLPTTTLNDKVNKFAKHLSTQLSNYISNPYDESKYIVQGLNKDSIQNFASYKAALDAIASRQATPQDILSIGDIVSALGNEGLTEAFETYFANELEGSDQVSQQSSQSVAVAQPQSTPVQEAPVQEAEQRQPEQQTEETTNNTQISPEITEKLSKIKELSDRDLAFIGTFNIAAPLPFVTPILVRDIISEEGKDFSASIAEFVKLYALAESGDKNSLNAIKNKFKRISEKHGNYAAGDEIIQELKRTGKYKQILKYCLQNAANDKEKEFLLNELNKPRDISLKRIITDSKDEPKTLFSSQQVRYQGSNRTYSQKQGGKLDKLQNYINNKNGK